MLDAFIITPQVIALLIIFFIQNTALGAIYGRMDGGGILKTHEQVERALIMFYFVAACIPFAGWWSILAYAGMVGIATGHGQWFLNLAVQAIEPEKTDYVVRLVYGPDPRTAEKYVEYRDYVDWYNKDPEKLKRFNEVIAPQIEQDMAAYGLEKLYRRNVFGFFVGGSLLGVPAALLALCFGAWLPALVLSLTGVVKATAYVIAYKFYQSTVPAEYINGGARTALALIALILGLFGYGV